MKNPEKPLFMGDPSEAAAVNPDASARVEDTHSSAARLETEATDSNGAEADTAALRLLGAGEEAGAGWGFWLFAGHISTLWGLALSNLFLGLTGIWVWRNRRRLPDNWPALALLLLPLGLYGISSAVSVLFSAEPAQSASGLEEVLNLTTLPFAALCIRGPKAVRSILTLFVCMAIAVAAVGLGQFFLTADGGLHPRITGAFSHYQTYSGILLLALLVVVPRLVGRSSKQLEIWLGFLRQGGHTGTEADLYLAAILGLIGFSIAGLFENNWGDTEVQRVVLFLLAIPVCLARPTDPSPRGPSSTDPAISAPGRSRHER